eukprot:TRINITY_DN3866_c0_g3_i1.p1 TRINITY_DN3866_c0_g3~~TRINITY_DN3866_c0_g3_i1.p1  ORF type:complete len:590 (-),score=119.92 TRINITY_DN3866_c0_g3_i1:32-1801(-)
METEQEVDSEGGDAAAAQHVERDDDSDTDMSDAGDSDDEDHDSNADDEEASHESSDCILGEPGNTWSISGVESTLQREEIDIGNLGFGYNVLDGSLTRQLFTHRSATCVKNPNAWTPTVKQSLFHSSLDYEVDVCTEIGVDEFISGMLSGGCAVSPCPSKIVNLEKFKYLVSRCTLSPFKTTLNVEDSRNDIFTLKDVQFLLSMHGLNETTQPLYYALIDDLGTHFITEVSHGDRAEMSWSYHADALDGSDLLDVRGSFLENWKRWSSVYYSVDEALFKSRRDELSEEVRQKQSKEGLFSRMWRSTRRAVSNVEEVDVDSMIYEDVQRVANETHLHLRDETHAVGSTATIRDLPRHPISFKVTHIAELFEDNVKQSIQAAVRSYIRDRRQTRVSEIGDGETVAIQCVASGHYWRADVEGHVFADVPTPGDKPECRFTLSKRNQSTFSLKNEKFNRYLSHTIMGHILCFNAQPFLMKAYQGFCQTGAFLQIRGSANGPHFLYTANSKLNKISSGVSSDDGPDPSSTRSGKSRRGSTRNGSASTSSVADDVDGSASPRRNGDVDGDQVRIDFTGAPDLRSRFVLVRVATLK